MGIPAIALSAATISSKNPKTQKNKMSAPVTVTGQPRGWKFEKFGCMEDKKLCCNVILCGPCLACELANLMGENPCVTCSYGWLYQLRTKYRVQQNIEGSACDDCCQASCYGACVFCQLYR